MDTLLTQPNEHHYNQAQEPDESAKNSGFKEGKFIPKGAIAFFVLLIMLCLAIWFYIYFLMLSRV